MQKDNFATDATAWLRAWRHRSCPPLDVLRGERVGGLARHLERCPWCASDAGMSATGSFPQADPSPAGQPVPSVGQVWSLSSRLAGWGPKARYYSPPLVLLVERPDTHAFNVVQVYDDPFFQGADDIPLDNGMTGFAETWNRYTVGVDDLALLFGRVSGEVVTRARQGGDAQKVEPGSLLWFFRNMEVETGFFFASRSVETLLASGEDPVPGAEPLGREKLLADLHALSLVVDLDEPENAPLPRLLAGVRHGEDDLPLAAAPEKGVAALLLRFGKAGLRDAETVYITVTHQEQRGDLLYISGTLPPDLDDDGMTMLAFLRCGSRLIEPVPGESGLRDGVFWAVFPVAGSGRFGPGELVIRLLCPGDAA